VRELTGRPTATLNKEILLMPTLRFTLLLKVNLGFSSPPYADPALGTRSW